MSNSTDEGPTALAPDEAFAVLGDETRMEILRALGDADGPLSFSTLHDRVSVRDSGQFNYHLGETEGHFVRKTDNGYVLAPAGRRVVEAVLTGAITETPELPPTRVDEPCPLCSAPTLLWYHDGRLAHYCTDCAGHYGRDDVPGEDDEHGFLGAVPLPPAGLQGRSPAAVFRAASTWFTLELLAMANRVCPRCSAGLSTTVAICDDHDPGIGACEECGKRHAVQVTFECPNCLFARSGALVVALLGDEDLLSFLTDHGANPLSPGSPAIYDTPLMTYEETVRSADPLDVRLSLTVDGETLTLRVDGDLQVVETRWEN